MSSVTYTVRPAIELEDLQQLFEMAWGGRKAGYERVLARSFTWVAAVEAEHLVGFVNVAWDGGAHLFLLDTTVRPDRQGAGIGSRLVDLARRACEGPDRWLHVDAEEALMRRLYLACGFERTPAGLLRLEPSGGSRPSS